MAGETMSAKRMINAYNIRLPQGYVAEPYLTQLNSPSCIAFDAAGTLYIADSGMADGDGKVLQYDGKQLNVLASGFNPPLLGIAFDGDDLFVSHRGCITLIKPDLKKVDILRGLPSWGDFSNSRIAIGTDGCLYFGQGTATNSGVVGADNSNWVVNHPYFNDLPGQDITLYGENYESKSLLSPACGEIVSTGAFSYYGSKNMKNEIIKSSKIPSGSIIRVNKDGSNARVYAWGLRNPACIRFDRSNRLFCSNQGMEPRGSRPVENAPDEFLLIKKGKWYGWPDYAGGLPVTLPQFKPKDGSQPFFLIKTQPMAPPPRPFALFEPHSCISGFDFSYDNKFGYGYIFVALGGRSSDSGKLSRIDMQTGEALPFAYNKGPGGISHPSDVLFGPDDKMYIADSGLITDRGFEPGTGVIWRVSKNFNYFRQA